MTHHWVDKGSWTCTRRLCLAGAWRWRAWPRRLQQWRHLLNFRWCVGVHQWILWLQPFVWAGPPAHVSHGVDLFWGDCSLQKKLESSAARHRNRAFFAEHVGSTRWRNDFQRPPKPWQQLMTIQVIPFLRRKVYHFNVRISLELHIGTTNHVDLGWSFNHRFHVVHLNCVEEIASCSHHSSRWLSRIPNWGHVYRKAMGMVQALSKLQQESWLITLH